MQVSNIPAELRERRQWVVWRAVDLGNGRVAKLPYNAYAPNLPAKANDPTTWADFDTAHSACLKDSRLGLGFVFAEADEYIGVDIDDAEKVAPELREKRQQVAERILSGTTTYMERSPSGKGYHLICKGKLPSSAHVVRPLQIEIYAHWRFFTMTGDVIDGRMSIANEQAMLDGFVEAFPKSDRSEYEEATLGPTTNKGRRLGLTDGQVLTIAGQKPGFIARYQGDHRDWSYEHKNLIGDLDKITGDPEQVRRIVQSSPLVLNVPDKGGITRLAKSQRLFFDLLSEVRDAFENSDYYPWYTLSPQFVEDGKRIFAEMVAAQEAAAKAIAERIILEQESVTGNSRRLLEAFPQLRPTDVALTYPPGMMGEIVKGIESTIYKPFTKFVIPAAFAMISGIAGRRYKLGSGGINLFFLLGAEHGIGKSQTMDAHTDLAYAINKALAGSRMGQYHSRILNTDTSSIQAIHEYFMRAPSLAWFVDECKSLVDKMSNRESSAVNAALRDGFNKLYDASKVGAVYMPPVSMNTKKHEFEPIPNLNVSCFWTTTNANLSFASKDVSDGFLSRMIVIRHPGRGGEADRNRTVAKLPPDEVMGRLFQLAVQAQDMDDWYKAGRPADGLVVSVSTAMVEDLTWDLREQADKIRDEVFDGKWPAEYHMISRVYMNAIRMAATMAVVENPYAPVVTEDQLLWSFGYVLQNVAALLSDMEQGEVGATMDKDISVVVRWIKKLMRKNKSIGAKRSEITEKVRACKPFVDHHNPGDALRRVIADMLANDLLIELDDDKHTGRGPAAKLLCPTNAKVWES